MNRNVRILVGLVVAGLVALLVGVIVTNRTSTTSEPLDPATGDTTGIAGTLPDVTAPAATGAWSDTADANFTTVKNAFAGTGSIDDVATLFGVPVAVPQPSDASLDHARYSLVANESGGAEESWSLWSLSTSSAADIESAFTSSFKSDDFTPGPRSENEFAGLTTASINYTPTPTGEAGGWVYMTVTIGPDTDGLTPTGKSFLRVDLTRILAAMPEPAQTPAFATGWLAEVPWLVGVVVMAGATFMQPLSGRILERKNPILWLIGLALVSAFSAIGLVYLTSDGMWLYVFVALWGAAALTTYPLYGGLVYAALIDDSVFDVARAILVSYGIAEIIAPPLLGMAIDAHGINWLFGLAALSGALLATLLAIWLWRERAGVQSRP